MDYLRAIIRLLWRRFHKLTLFAIKWLPEDHTQRRIGFWARVVTLILAAAILLPDHSDDNFREIVRQELQDALRARESAALRTSSAATPPPNTSDGLAVDLDAAIDTLLANDKADALKDKTGQAAEAALEKLIAERRSTRIKIDKDEAALWRQKGALAFLHDTHAARAAYQRAIELDPNNAQGLYQLGQLHFRTGHLDSAIKAFEQVRAIGDATAFQAMTAKANTGLGNVHLTRGDVDRALAMHRKALSLNEQLDSKEGMATDYNNLGNVYNTRGDLEHAEEMYTKALTLNEQLGNRDGIASGYSNLGVVYRKRGDLVGAEKMYKMALALNEQLGQKEGMAIQYGNLGIIYATRGDPHRAEEMHSKALALNEQLGHNEGMASDYANLGLLEVKRGNISAACTLWLKAADLYRAVGNPNQVEYCETLMHATGCLDK